MDVGRFHRWLSLIILAVAPTFSAGGVLAWWNRPGEWLLVIAAGLSAVLLWLDVRDAPKKLARRPTRSRMPLRMSGGAGPRQLDPVIVLARRLLMAGASVADELFHDLACEQP